MTLPAIPLEFGEWLPDLPALENPGALIARNVIGHATSYSALNSLSAFSNALASVCLGAIWFQGSDNTIYNFAGDASALYRLDGNTTWTDVSKVGGYTAPHWEFAKFGDRCLAFADGEDPQYYDVGSSSLFADLPGSPYVAARVGVIRDFVVLGDLEAYGPNVLGWSGYNSSELWTPSRATQSDRQELFGRGGRVQRIVPGEYGVIFQEHSIYRMDYAGPPIIFQLDEVERGRGTPAGDSVCWTGSNVFYLGHDGFYAFDGRMSQPIGVDRVNRWFATNADPSGLSTTRGVIDRRNRLAMWAFKSSGSLAYNDRIIIFNWGSNKWTYGEVDTEVLAEFVSSGFSLDQLDTPLPNGIDIDSIPVDSDAFKGGVLGLQAFDTSHRAATFSGTPLEALLDTKELHADMGQRVYTNAQRPIVDGTDATVMTVALGTRNVSGANVAFGTPRGVNQYGMSNIRNNSRYHRYRVSISGGFNHAQGIEIHQKPVGRR